MMCSVHVLSAPFAPFLDRLAQPPPDARLDDAAGGELDFLVRSHLHDLDGGRMAATYVYPSVGAEHAAIPRLAPPP